MGGREEFTGPNQKTWAVVDGFNKSFVRGLVQKLKRPHGLIEDTRENRKTSLAHRSAHAV